MKRTVSREKRVLLVVNCLAEHGDSRFRWLYHFIETAGAEIAKRFLTRHYRCIYFLRDQRATLAAFLNIVNKLSLDSSTEALDLFLQLHGEPGRLHFYDQWVSARRLRAEIKRVVNRDCLRLVYNTSCYGDSHSADLLKAGFKASVGSRRVNANAASEYPIFCRNWPSARFLRKRTLTVQELVRKADLPKPRRISDRLASRYFKDVDSTKVLRGNGSITINSGL
ncbi:MAG: hypothetical protein K0B84_09370 [Firmicutes bacterium]|nr:hypothetical protein [Bacillota bacterium]